MSDRSKDGKPNQIKVKTSSRTASDELTKPLAEEAKELRGTLGFLANKLERLSIDMEKAQLSEYVNLMHRPLQLIWRNFISGLSRGVGIALGFTFFAATIVYLLQILGALNLPIVGDYIADIVRIVQRQLQINPY
ncbi:DUF5665 domain-containing protein [Cohnella silvisoli]|uniref:DUF5665 domain-containing protein n=1 Tax=Cohnella silvisoli TaxID=2873699 RepID=A0ABV1KZK9_9BACL|nr:DUF5665 domain-containing protein [Cohnella silvisoli]MCD9024412.1 DUF5665 domain-containing protein [Cohnella silvisoli]